MSVRRVMGTEVEYGISVQGQPSANPMVASSQVVNAYASSTVKARRARWDFEEESPLRDARGFDMARQIADPSQLTDEDLVRLRELIGRIARTRPLRRSRRTRRDPLGESLDVRGMIRRSLRTGGDPVDRPLRARKEVPRRLVLLCDVSGSMDSYARGLLLFLHAAVGAGHGVEAFAFGTRLSRLTPELATRDPMTALARCTEEAVDWGSGTRIGASLREFNEVYGRRAVSRGAIVVIVSDGWENSPPGLAGEVLRVWRTRLDPGRACAVVHLNPVYDADDFDVRRLAPTVPTAGIREAENLPALVQLAGFAEGRTGLAELRVHLDRRVADFLKEGA